MIDMQLLDGALLALLVVVGAAIGLSLAMVAAAALTWPGQTRSGGTRRVIPARPVHDDYQSQVPVPVPTTTAPASSCRADRNSRGVPDLPDDRASGAQAGRRA